MEVQTRQLRKGLNVFHLWGLAVGLVISGEYFGWSYGWASAGTLGFLITTVVVAIMYTAFIFSFTELTTAIPNAGGPFAYAHRAFGRDLAFFAGLATPHRVRVRPRPPSPWRSAPISRSSSPESIPSWPRSAPMRSSPR